MLDHVGPRTKAVFVANPNNPTGTWLPKSEILRLADGLPEQVLLVLDMAYAEYVEEAEYDPGFSLVTDRENVVVLRTFSKIHGLAGLRIGWAYAPPGVVDTLHRSRCPFNANAAAQAAAAAAIGDSGHVSLSVNENARLRKKLGEGLSALGIRAVPSMGNFCLAEFTDAADAAAAHRALREKSIFVRRMDAYGLPRCLRITVGLEESVVAVLSALEPHFSPKDGSR